MQCNRLIALVKNWYIQVQNEAMAPARMVEFMTKHIATCEVCVEDPDIREESNKIRDIVLPPSKVPKPAEPEEEEDEREEYPPEETENYVYTDEQDEDSDADENDIIDAD
jgi:hypothetical protein